MKSETIDYLFDSMIELLQSLWTKEQQKKFIEDTPGLKWDLPTLEDTLHAFCRYKYSKEFMIEKIVNFIKDNKLEE